MRLRLEEVTQNGKKLLTELDSNRISIGRASIGRDLTSDIPLSNEAVSRTHGIFFPLDSGWAFQDGGSTNGTWVNGEKLEPHRLVALVDGDYLQLADAVIKVSYDVDIFSSSPARKNGWRLFALQDGKNAIELNPLDFEGMVTAQNGIAFELMNNDQPSLSGLFVLPEGASSPVIVNGETVTHTRKLAVNDYVECEDFIFLIVFGDLVSHKVSSAAAIMVPAQVETKVDLTAVEGSARVFSAERTGYIEPARIAKLKFGEKHTGSDFGEDEYDVRQKQESLRVSEFISHFFYRLSDVEKRILIGAGFFFISALIFLFILLLI